MQQGKWLGSAQPSEAKRSISKLTQNIPSTSVNTSEYSPTTLGTIGLYWDFWNNSIMG